MGETGFLIRVSVTVVGNCCQNGLVHVILEYHHSNITGNIIIHCHFSSISLHALIIKISKKSPINSQESSRVKILTGRLLCHVCASRRLNWLCLSEQWVLHSKMLKEAAQFYQAFKKPFIMLILSLIFQK